VKPISRRAAVLAIAIATFASALSTSATVAARGADATAPGRVATGPREASKKVIVKKHRIAPGLTFTRIIDKRTPRLTYILRMQPAKPVALDVALAGDALPTRRTVLEIAKAHGAIAAVNGDFGSNDGRPAHPFAEDGELVETSIQRGPLFALAQDERQHYLGKPSLEVTLTDPADSRSWTIDRWNDGAPAPGEIVGYSPLGGSLEAPPAYMCSVRLLPAGPAAFDHGGTGIVRDYVVDKTGCSDGAMGRNGGIVLSAPPATDEATELLAMQPGTSMQLRWSLGWTDVSEMIGGMPILVQDGQVVAPNCTSSFCRPNPRTGIGYTARGGIILVCVDGRQRRSRGVTLVQFAQIMRSLGAVDALNLDGGGSTTMVVNGQVVNHPSDGHPRNVTNAVLVLPGPDRGEPS
jgi:hypothetical protein